MNIQCNEYSYTYKKVCRNVKKVISFCLFIAFENIVKYRWVFSRSVFSVWGNFALQETSGNVWAHTWVSKPVKKDAIGIQWVHSRDAIKHPATMPKSVQQRVIWP